MVKLLGLLAFSVFWAVSAQAQEYRGAIIVDPGRSVTEYRSNRDGSGGVFVMPEGVEQYRYMPPSSYGDGGGVSRDYGRGYGGYGGVSR